VRNTEAVRPRPAFEIRTGPGTQHLPRRLSCLSDSNGQALPSKGSALFR
jgi:hypothetical protein